MPRSASKSQADKQEESLVQLSTPSALDQEVNDEKEKAVAEIIDDLMAQVMDSYFQACIEAQLVPFSALWAKSYITEVLERQFICLDVAEKLDEATGTEDAEPEPVTSDVWALGCVPVLIAPHQHDPALHQETIIDGVPAKKNSQVSLPSDVLAQKTKRPKQDEKYRRLKEPAAGNNFPRKGSFSSKEVPDILLPPLSCSTKDTVNVENNNMTSLMSRPSQSHKDTLTVPKFYSE